MNEQTVKNRKVKRGSHFLPRVYLRNFLIDDKLFVYKKGKKFFSDKISIEQRILEAKGEGGLDNIAKENNLYRIEVSDLDPNTIEDLFRELTEDNFNDLVRQISIKKIGDRIEPDLKEKLSFFIASMRVRTPQFKWEIEEMAGNYLKMITNWLVNNTPLDKERLKREFKKDTGKILTDRDIEMVKKQISEGKLDDIEVSFSNNNLFLKIALFLIGDYSKIFSGMKINILAASKSDYFITSDNPVVYFVPKDKVDFYNNYKNLMSPYVELFFPLTKNIGIHLNRDKRLTETVMPAYSFTGINFVDIFNYNISHHSKDFIFSPIKLSSLDKFIEKYIPYPFKLTTSRF